MRPKFENQRERFLCLAESRTNKALNVIRTIKHMSNKFFYSYKQKEIDKIFSVLREAIDEAEATFKDNSIKKFKL